MVLPVPPTGASEARGDVAGATPATRKRGRRKRSLDAADAPLAGTWKRQLLEAPISRSSGLSLAPTSSIGTPRTARRSDRLSSPGARAGADSLLADGFERASPPAADAAAFQTPSPNRRAGPARHRFGGRKDGFFGSATDEGAIVSDHDAGFQKAAFLAEIDHAGRLQMRLDAIVEMSGRSKQFRLSAPGSAIIRFSSRPRPGGAI